MVLTNGRRSTITCLSSKDTPVYERILLTLATVAALVEIAVLVLIRLGILGSGELAFHRFVWYGGSAAAIAVVTAVAAITVTLLRRNGLGTTVLTLLLCTLAPGIFLRVLIWGCPF